MKQNRYASVLLAAPLLLAFSVRGDGVGFHPAEGHSVSKTFTSTSDIELDEMSMSMNGQEMPAEMVQMEMSVNSKMTISVTDEYLASADGRATKLKRTYDEIGMNTNVDMSNPMMGDIDSEVPGSSELEGKTVVFKWVDEGDAYNASFEGDDADEALLDNLDADMDLTAFLPDGEVSKGDKWEIDPEAMRVLFVPGGDLKLEMETEDEGMMGAGPQPSPFEAIGEFDGDIEAVFDGYKEVDGVRCALVKLTAEVTSAKDLTDFFQESMSGEDMPVEVEMEIHACDMEVVYECEGELLWNVTDGVLHSLSVKGDMSQTMDMDMSITAAGQSQDLEQSMEMSGEVEVTISVSSE